MHYKKIAETFIVRLEIGEELCECLLSLAEKEGIGIAEISGIGAASSAQAGIFDAASKSYVPVETEDYMELVSLTGNLTRKDGRPYLHVHALLADPVSGKSLAGHLTRLVIGATAEIFVRVLPGEAGRMVCGETGLNLMDV